MSAAEILDRARAAGVRVEVHPHGDRLRLNAPEKPADELLDLLKENKPDIIKFLRDRGAIGNVMAPRPHRRCTSCGSGLARADGDRALCSACRWWFKHIEPRRPQ